MIALKRITTLKKLNKKEDVHLGNKSFSNPENDYEAIPVSLIERWFVHILFI